MQQSEQKGLPNVLVLGGGWVGTRLAGACDAQVTHRNNQTGGIEFRIDDESTWCNLPHDGELAAVITFSLDVIPFEQLQRFHQQYLSKIACVIAYSTTSVYEVRTPEEEVDENTPLNGRDLRGQSLEARIKAEEYLRENGAIILTLSGIFGEDRTIDGLLKKGYIKNGNKLVNWIHVDDIIKITQIFLKDRHNKNYHNQRYNVTSGAYRWGDLCKCYGQPPLPTAPTDTTSKVVSNKKLVTTVLPSGYTFRRADEADESLVKKNHWDAFLKCHAPEWRGIYATWDVRDLSTIASTCRRRRTFHSSSFRCSDTYADERGTQEVGPWNYSYEENCTTTGLIHPKQKQTTRGFFLPSGDGLWTPLDPSSGGDVEILIYRGPERCHHGISLSFGPDGSLSFIEFVLGDDSGDSDYPARLSPEIYCRMAEYSTPSVSADDAKGEKMTPDLKITPIDSLTLPSFVSRQAALCFPDNLAVWAPYRIVKGQPAGVCVAHQTEDSLVLLQASYGTDGSFGYLSRKEFKRKSS